MTDSIRTLSESARRHAEQLVRLHAMIAAMADETNQGDALRDEMDDTWYASSVDEQELLGGLSEDLYSLGQTPVVANEPSKAIAEQIGIALRAEDIAGSLKLLREFHERLPAADVAVLRGTLYGQLGAPLAAAQFFREAIRLGSRSPACYAMWWRALESAGLVNVAAESAANLVENVALNDPTDWFVAAEVLLLDANGRDSTTQLRFEQAIRALDQGFCLVANTSVGVDANLLLEAKVYSAWANFILGRLDESLLQCELALKQSPNHKKALLLRAWLKRSQEPELAKRDFSAGFAAEIAERTMIPSLPFASSFAQSVN